MIRGITAVGVEKCLQFSEHKKIGWVLVFLETSCVQEYCSNLQIE